jgi:predicted helicase
VQNTQRAIENYNDHVDRWSKRRNKRIKVDDFVDNDPRKLSWSESLKKFMLREQPLTFDEAAIRSAHYRPFTKQFLYFDPVMNERRYQMPISLPTTASELENQMICVSDLGYRAAFSTLVTTCLPDFHVLATADTFQCFPFYTYDGQVGARRENISPSTLVRFQQHYCDEQITKWDIFHYVYAVLHHPEYRTRYAANLRRELPRIPLVGKNANVFHAYAEIGRKLADLHAHYERTREYPLKRVENSELPLDWRVKKMRLSKDKTAVVYNDFLTLAGVPEAAFAYRLGNRSALEWVIDQYQVSTDARSGIINDPNRGDEPDYIVKLVGRVITVSLETQKLIAALPPLEMASDPALVARRSAGEVND